MLSSSRSSSSSGQTQTFTIYIYRSIYISIHSFPQPFFAKHVCIQHIYTLSSTGLGAGTTYTSNLRIRTYLSRLHMQKLYCIKIDRTTTTRESIDDAGDATRRLRLGISEAADARASYAPYPTKESHNTQARTRGWTAAPLSWYPPDAYADRS